jgi:hypothetical protein
LSTDDGDDDNDDDNDDDDYDDGSATTRWRDLTAALLIGRCEATSYFVLPLRFASRREVFDLFVPLNRWKFKGMRTVWSKTVLHFHTIAMYMLN